MPSKTAAPMFAPFKLREIDAGEPRHRLADGDVFGGGRDARTTSTWCICGERALGGAGLVFTEMTCVSPEGRISPGCTGMWTADHVAAWKRIVDFVHSNSKAKLCLQLGHSGAKGSTKLGWEGNDVPLDDGNWPVDGGQRLALVAGQPDPQGNDPRRHGPGPRPVRRRGAHGSRMRVRHGRAPRRPRLFAVELHHPAAEQAHRRLWRGRSKIDCAFRWRCSRRCALRGRRTGRCRLRISATTDWAGDQGVTPDEAVEIGEAFAREGADLIDVSAGQTWTDARPVYGRICSRRPSATRSATRASSRRWRWATDPQMSPTCQFDPRRRPRRPGRVAARI